MNLIVSFNIALLAALFMPAAGCIRHETRYAPEYSEEKFAQIKTGDSSNRVITLLGPPLRIDHQHFSEQWIYGTDSNVPSSDSRVFVKQTTIPIPEVVLYFGTDGLVTRYFGDRGAPLEGKDKNAVLAALGPPRATMTNKGIFILNYTEGKHSESFHVRSVIINERGLVLEKKSFYYRD